MTRALLVAGLAGLAACQPPPKAEFHYFPPVGERGQACVHLCYAQADACVERALDAAEAEPGPAAPTDQVRQSHAECLKRTAADYRQCQRAQVLRGENWNPCYRPVCVVGGETGTTAAAGRAAAQAACDSGFQDCFRGCGGRIEVR